MSCAVVTVEDAVVDETVEDARGRLV